MKEKFLWFLENFGKPPKGEPREIPARIRMPLFLGMLGVGIVGLWLVWALWLAPQLRTQAATPGVGMTAPSTAATRGAQ